MLETIRETLRIKGRVILSVLVVVALVMPALSLSDLAPAYAEPDGATETMAGPSYATDGIGRIDLDVPLDGTVVDASGAQTPVPTSEGQLVAPATEEQAKAILERYLADGTLTDADLQNEFVVDSLTGSYLEDAPSADALSSAAQEVESRCGNHLDSYDDVLAEEQRKEQEADQRSAAASAEVEPFTEEMVDEIARKAAEAEAALDGDPALAAEPAAGPRPLRSFASALDALWSALLTIERDAAPSARSYSTDIELKDVKSVALYNQSGFLKTHDFFFSDVAKNPSRYTVFVRSYNMPAFYAPVVSARYADGKGYITLKMPTSLGEAERTSEIFFTTGVGSDGYVNVVAGQPGASESTVLAKLATVPGYDASRDRAYLNAYRLAPFAPYADIVMSGNAMVAGSALATKAIQELWPVREGDGMRVSLMEGEETAVTRAMVCFSDGTFEALEVDHLGTHSLAATYVTKGSGLLYQPDFWVLGEESRTGIDRISSFIRSKSWDSYFGTFNKDSRAKVQRVVRDHYDVDIRGKAERVAADLVSNIDAWSAVYTDCRVWQDVMSTAETAMPSTDWGATAPEVQLFNLLMLYTYYDRFFDFDFGGSEEEGFHNDANAFLIMAFRGGILRSGCSLVNMTPMVRSSSMYTLAAVDKLSSGMFVTMLQPYTGVSSITALIERLVARTTNYTNVADWFADYMSTIAFYHEYEPPAVEGVVDPDQLTWRGWDQVKRYPDCLPLWLTLKPGSQYFASTAMLIATGSTGIYETNVPLDEAHRASYKTRLDNIFVPASRYSASVASIVGMERANRVCAIGCDQKASRIDGGTSWLERENYWGKKLTEDPYHKGFTDPIGYYISAGQGAAAMTLNSSLTKKRIHFLAYTSLGCAWNYYWSHEMAHAIDNDVFLNGDRRGGDNTEDYTDGFLTQSHGRMSYTMNLTYDYSLSTDMTTNVTRERIQSKEKVNDYYSKLYDTLDVLDYAALKAFLELDKDEQTAVASQAWFDGQNGSSALDTGSTATILWSRKKVLDNYDGTDATTPVNSAAFVDGTRKFETPEEVYDNQIFLFPGLGETNNATWLWANYVSTDLTGVWWFPVHCNGNRPDSRSFKLQCYRMFGSDGYDAWANFARSGGGDLAKLKAITGYSSFKEWQMAKWSAIEANKSGLSYIGFDELVDKFEMALRADAEKRDRNLTQMNSLRVRMLYMMKRITNDFRYGIYDDHAPVKHISTLADLRAIAEDPYGNYVLDNDIDASGVLMEGTKGLVDCVFMGKLDGQGHAISSAETILPNLFTGVKHGYIKDLTLCGVPTDRISASIVNSELDNISYQRFERKIYDVEDFVGVADDLKIGVDKFHLMADLDFTEWSAANEAAEAKADAVVSQAMSGTVTDPKVFEGNGHVITGLTGASLFANVYNAQISGLTIRECSNLRDAASSQQLGILASRSLKSKFSDLFFDKVELRGKARIGFVSGDDGWMGVSGVTAQGSRFERIQVTNGKMTCGTAAVSAQSGWGGFITGWMLNGSMEDIYVQGSLATYGARCGGVLGAIAGSAQLNRCISKVDLGIGVNGVASKVGVLLGDIDVDHRGEYDAESTRISNCIGLGKPTPRQSDFEFPPNTGWRLAGYTVKEAASAFQNCYEDTAFKFGRTLTQDETADVSYARSTIYVAARDEQGSSLPGIYSFPYLRDKATYERWGFSDQIWEFDPTIKVGHPVLRFEGDKETFFDYDMDFKLDYKSEKLLFWGSSFDRTKVRIHNLPYRALKDDAGHNISKGDWQNPIFSSLPPTKFSSITEEPDSIDLSEVIEYERFENEETALKGTRSVSLYYDVRDSGKPYSFEKSIEVSPRPKMDCADRVHGVQAGADGMGAIHFASIGIYDASELEYRPAIAENAVAVEQSGSGGWTPITAAVTPVEPGEYEVRIAATDHSFASYAVQVEVAPYDPSAFVFPLVLDRNGGEWAEGYAPPQAFDKQQGLRLPTADDISRSGYTFRGWYAEPDFSGSPVTEVVAGTAEPKTFFARWDANAYDVKLHLEGGSFRDPGDEVSRYVAGVGAMLPVPVHPYRAFAGWYDNAECIGSAIEAISPSDFGDKELWAKWDAVTYTVILHVQDGLLPEGMDAVFTYEAGVGAALPGAGAITREGHTFRGWYEDQACMGAPLSAISSSDTGDKELWAKWTADIYDVVLVMNQGKPLVGESDIVSYQYGIEVQLPEMERNGYEFGGWYDNDAFTGSPVKIIPAGEMGDKRFWAQWKPYTYTISYDLGKDDKGDIPPAIDLDGFLSYTTGPAFRLPDTSVMTWEGHVFAGWYDNADLTGSSVTEIPAEGYGDVTFYAKWAGNACVLSYHGNGGSFVGELTSVFDFDTDGVSEGDEVRLPDATLIARTGYTFDGWYQEANLSGEAIESVRLVRGVIELYAKWSPVEYKIAYELNDGTWVAGYSAPRSYTIESPLVMLPAATSIVREGYEFKGWYDTSVLDGAQVTAIHTGGTGDKTFYAKWEERSVAPPDPGPGPGPEEPELKIVSIVLEGVAETSVTWDENGYGRIEVPRANMPTKPEDLHVTVPTGVEVHSIEKRERGLFEHVLAFFAATDTSSDIWDIVLRSIADPSHEKRYTLEVVPVDDETPPGGDGDGDDNPGGDGDGDDNPGGDGDNDPGGDGDGNGDGDPGGDGDNSPGGDGDGDNPGGDGDGDGDDGPGGNGDDEPGNNDDQRPGGDGPGGSGGGPNGSSSGSGNGKNDMGSGIPGGNASGGSGTLGGGATGGAGSNGSSNGGTAGTGTAGGASGGNGAKATAVGNANGTALTATGDDLVALSAVLAMTGLVLGLIGVILYRRGNSRR